MKNKKRVIVILIVVLVVALIIITNKSLPTGQSVQIEIIPLSLEEKQIIQSVLTSNDFVNDVPEKYPVSIRFFSFSNGQRVWHDGFITGNSENKPEIYLSLHSKYISELKNQDICEVIKTANRNGDLGFYSESNKASLLFKYSKMLKHGKCFGF